jgi:hypothetical protein
MEVACGFPGSNSVNPETPSGPFCGFWMILNVPGQKSKGIFHPTIFGAAS